jgi:hypothetical protein
MFHNPLTGAKGSKTIEVTKDGTTKVSKTLKVPPQ